MEKYLVYLCKNSKFLPGKFTIFFYGKNSHMIYQIKCLYDVIILNISIKRNS